MKNKFKKVIYPEKQDLVLFFSIIAIIFVLAKFAIYFKEFHLSARFQELPPIGRTTSVLMRGVKVGEVEELNLTKDLNYTIIKMKLYDSYHIPVGTIAKIKSHFLTKTYVDLEIPEKRTKVYIKEFSVIPGEMTLDAQALLDKHLEQGTIDNMIGSVKGAMTNANNITANLNESTEEILQIIVHNKSKINKLVDNFVATSENVKNFTFNLNDILSDGVVAKQIKKTLTHIANIANNLEKTTGNQGFAMSAENVKESTESLKVIMKNLEGASGDVKDTTSIIKNSMCTTMSKAHSLIDEGIHTAKSVSHLSSGLSETASQRFLFWKLMFGKPGESLQNPPRRYYYRKCAEK